MVALIASDAASLCLLAQAPLQRMDPENRARVIMLIVGLVIMGVAMIVFIAMGARWVRNMVRRRDGQARTPIEDKWYARPLVEPLKESSDRDEPEA